ncbi:MAG: hypothetical protein D6711_10685 [Chloroflexi bacterium]|nr:MAG: hypothetical protein D6711_10685 [Chloroflexota bacterium]
MYLFVNSTEKFNIENNFWELNPQIKYIEPYKKLYDRDTTPDKSKSSKEMWCIWLYKDPSYNNKIGKLPDKDKKEAIRSYYPEFNEDDPVIAECMLKYVDHCLTPAARAYMSMETAINNTALKINELSQNTDELTLDEYIPMGGNRFQLIKGKLPQLMKLFEQKNKLIEQYFAIKERFEEEQAEERIYGGGKLSLADKGDWEQNIDLYEEE